MDGNFADPQGVSEGANSCQKQRRDKVQVSESTFSLLTVLYRPMAPPLSFPRHIVARSAFLRVHEFFRPSSVAPPVPQQVDDSRTSSG